MSSLTTTLPFRGHDPYRISKTPSENGKAPRLILNPNFRPQNGNSNGVINGTQHGYDLEEKLSYWDQSIFMEDIEIGSNHTGKRPKKAIKWDPEVSYVDKTQKDIEEVERPQKKKLWTRQDPPVLKREDIPSEWDWTEADYDLDPNDYDAQVERCHERIKDGILPVLFEHRLVEVTELKEKRDKLLAKYPGKSLNVAYRLETLKECLDFIKKNSDVDTKYKQRKNVEALIKAYKSGKIDWNPQLVTYWSHGKQICQPRPFDWDEFLFANEKHEGWEGFWVEGYNQPQPKSFYFTSAFFPGNNEHVQTRVNQLVRLPGTDSHVEFDFADDTGSSDMTLAARDIDTVVSFCGGTRRPPAMGMSSGYLADGSVTTQYFVALEVTLENMRQPSNWRRALSARRPGHHILPHWTLVQTAIQNNHNAPRLVGPWLRDQLFVLSIPDGQRNLHIFDEAAGLSRRHFAQDIQRAGSITQRATRPLTPALTGLKALPKGMNPRNWPGAPAFAPRPRPDA
ncbi:hypothetical protein N7540_001982 [Penicillium herquei]|nr:hypothetical protein N7540_001982 [Penicillium herquei]